MVTQDKLDALRSRSDLFGVSSDPEALETNRAILRVAPADPVASNRLAIGLFNAGELAEAEAVLIAAVEAHPGNAIATKRLDEVRRKRARAVAAPEQKLRRRSARPRMDAAPSYWIKSLHYHDDDWTVDVGEVTWISDIGRRRANGERVYRADGVPWGEPSWRIGDEIGLYFGGTLKLPVMVEVIAPPEFNPELVQQDSHGQESDAGERWPWVTHVRGLHSVPLEDAPTLDDVDIPRELVQRRPRFTITPDQHRALLAALTAARRPSPDVQPPL